MEQADVPMVLDYLDTEKLVVYEKLCKTSVLVAYNIKRLMPEVKGKIILDLPCGIGYYVREVFNLGAAKVIAADLVSCQLEFSKERDKEAGVPNSFVEYHQLDARIPQKISSEFADVCLSFHLFCFAETESDLRRMVQTILTNLKSGGCCLIIACHLSTSSNDEKKVRSELERIGSDEKVIRLDPPSSDRFKPRVYHTVQEGFHFNRFVWPHDVICDVLREEGFSKVQSMPYEVDPRYAGDIDLQAYIDLHNCKVIVAYK